MMPHHCNRQYKKVRPSWIGQQKQVSEKIISHQLDTHMGRSDRNQKHWKATEAMLRNYKPSFLMHTKTAIYLQSRQNDIFHF